jgi:hypothetical protein
VAPLGVGRVDDLGWGYQLRLSASYDRIFGTPVSFLPALAFRHDVGGHTPAGAAAFSAGAKQVGLSLEFNYQQRWSGILSYFNSFGGGVSNGSRDRDFVGMSLSYAF